MPGSIVPSPSGLSKDHEQTLSVITAKAIGLGVSVSPIKRVTDGTMVTLYRLQPQGRTRASHVEGIAQDIALVLCVDSVFVQAIPHEGAIGIYVPRKDAKPTPWVSLVSEATMLLRNNGIYKDFRVPLVLGSDWLGKVFIDDLCSLPHLLGAGSTGGGKSVWLRSLLASIVCIMNNQSVQIVLSDTKQVEFQDFAGSPFLLFGERATSVGKTIAQMKELHKMTDMRLGAIAAAGVRNLHEYNARFTPNDAKREPYIVLGIDELADLVDDGEAMYELDYITRKSRAAGIHVVATTQRPSADVLKGLIKNNFLARCSFRMPDGTNSRIVLGENGAEQLMKQGDMLYKSPNFPGLLRLHSGYATSADIRGTLEYTVYKHMGMSNEIGLPLQ